MSVIRTTIYHRYLKLLGYKVEAKSKNYHYFLGDDEVIREVYAGTNGNGVRGYVYPSDATKTGVFKFDERDPSFFRMRDALAMAAQKHRNGPRYGDGAYNLGHMFFDAKDGLDGIHFVFETAQIISFQHTHPYDIALSSTEEHCNYAKTEASKLLHRLHSDLDGALEDEVVGNILFKRLIQFIQRVNAQIWLWNRSNAQSVPLLSIKDIAKGREFWGLESGVPSLARTQPWFGQNKSHVWMERFKSALASLLDALQNNITVSVTNRTDIDTTSRSGIQRLEIDDSSFTPSIGQNFFPTPIAQLYSAYSNTNNPTYKYAYAIRTIEAVLQLSFSFLVSELAAIVNQQGGGDGLRKRVKEASKCALKPSIGALYKELEKLVQIRSEVAVSMFFPELETLVQSQPYTVWLQQILQSRNRFAHDELFLPLEQAKRKMLELDIEKKMQLFLNQVAWLQKYQLGHFENCQSGRFDKTKIEATWVGARGIMEPGKPIEVTLRVENSHAVVQNTVYVWSKQCNRLLNLYPYIIQYEYTRSVLLWIRGSEYNADEDVREFLYRHPVDDFYHLQGFLPEIGSHAYKEYRENIFRAHSVEIVEIEKGDLETGIETMDLGVFTKIRRLGLGGAGEVYLARNFIDETKQVALKVLKPALMQDIQMVKRFHYEGRLQRLKHDNVIQIYSTGLVNGLMYIEMEYVHGWTLRQKIDQGIQQDDCYWYMSQLLEGIAYLHDRQIYHRDIKPSNVMIRTDNILKIIDFGIAKDLSREEMTQTLNVDLIGTLAYRDPKSGSTDWHLADIYGLGLLFACLNGYGPDKYGRRIETLPSRLSQWQNWYSKAINFDRSKRFQSIAEMKIEFDRIRASL